MLLARFPVGALGCNCSIVADPATRDAVVIDPGDDAPRVLDVVKAEGLTVRAILHTHAHLDHVMATARVRAETGAPALLHPGDRPLWDHVEAQAAMLRQAGVPVGPVAPLGDVDRPLADGDAVPFGGLSIEVLHTPGHTPGSVCFRFEEGDPLLFAGDTLFRGSVGRTDLWGGDTAALLSSIRSRVLTLPDETRVIPGHGPDTTIARERRYNPFLT